MSPPRRTAPPPAQAAPHQPRSTGIAPCATAGPLESPVIIQITVTIVLPERLAWLLTAAAAIMKARWLGW